MKGDFSKRSLSYELVTPSNYATLQIQVLIKIFSHLENDFLLKRVSFVCKHWRFAVMQPPFIKSLYVHEMNDIPVSYTFSFIRTYINLQNLTLHGISKPSDILMQVSKCTKCLKNLALISCKNVERGLLQFIVRKFPWLESLNLDGTNFDEIPTYTMIKCLKNLRSLNLSKIMNLQMHIILETVLNCRQLEEIHLSLLSASVNLTDDDACLIIINKGQSLKSLSIDARLLTSRTYEKLLECMNLEALHISYAVNVSSDFLIDILHRLPPLKSFGLSHNYRFTDEEISAIFDAENVHDLTKLDFSRCHMLGDKTIELISNNCKSLERINLKCCKNIKRINPLMESCKDLKYVNIAFCLKLELPFLIHSKMVEIILHEDEKYENILTKMKKKKNLRVFLALSEYTENLQRI